MQKVQYAFLDSGVGGIPYLQCLLQKAPTASLLYAADTEHFPYGNKSKEEVITFSKNIVSKIIKLASPSIIIVACNTITVSALEALRQTFNIPFVGTVPAIKLAKKLSHNNNIGLIGTTRTLEDAYIKNLTHTFAADANIIPIVEAKLIEEIENGLMFSPEEEQLHFVLPILRKFKEKSCDTLILGCTHFLHLLSAFTKAGAMYDITIADSLDGVVRQALKLSPPTHHLPPKKLFYASRNKNNTYHSYAKKWSLDLIKEL